MIVRQLIEENFSSFQGTIKVGEIKKKETQPNSIEVREFKKLQYKSVDPREVDEILQFLLERIDENKEHFMGTFTFGVLLPKEEIPFHSLSLSSQGIYSEEAHELQNFGVLQVEHETWIPIDGLHRYYAIIKALRELPTYKRKIFENEEIPVILIPCLSLDQLQDLMLRLQKSVRAVDRGEAIRTASKDIYAQLARKVCGIDGAEEGVIQEKMVNWKTNTLTNRLQKFTTLSVLYDSAKILYPNLSNQTFSTNEITRYYKEFAEIWKTLITNFEPFRKATDIGADNTHLRDKYICLKATGQLVVIQTLKLAFQDEGQRTMKKTIEGLNRVPWELENPIWKNILLINGRLNAGDSARFLAAQLIGYHIGVTLSEKEFYDLSISYKKAKQEDLPTPLYNQTLS